MERLKAEDQQKSKQRDITPQDLDRYIFSKEL
jgi:hypothetical protein